MKYILRISLIVLFFLAALSYSVKDIYPTDNILQTQQVENFGDYTISKIGKVNQIFPKKAKGLSNKIPISRNKPVSKDEIEDIQEVDPDIVEYIRR